MLEAWTGEIKGRCHVAQIKIDDLAAACDFSPTYLSRVLNGHDCSEKTKAHIFAALDRLEEKVREEEANHEDHSEANPPGRS